MTIVHFKGHDFILGGCKPNWDIRHFSWILPLSNWDIGIFTAKFAWDMGYPMGYCFGVHFLCGCATRDRRASQDLGYSSYWDFDPMKINWDMGPLKLGYFGDLGLA